MSAYGPGTAGLLLAMCCSPGCGKSRGEAAGADAGAVAADAAPERADAGAGDSGALAADAPADAGPQCKGKLPHWSEALGRCCECLVAWDCGGYACDPSSCTCTGELGADCSLCVGDTPRCLVKDGVFQACVQCLSAADCPGDDAYCEKNLCTTPAPPPPSIEGIEVLCQDGVCWGKDGRCLPGKVVCMGGAACITLDDVLEPEEPKPEPDPGGYCACATAEDCPEGTACGQGPLALVLLLSGSQAKAPNHCYEP